ncbi:HigA family addiction module antitoxin [Umezakia ovalisporum]|jgi:addiction module HigA family antidote|uniref:HigA family addiction module antitoxin n=1 Tax=Umezakia ovalisporum TaxID=75695 RepID=UPI0024768958|nr:HigA family addiction module antitoxin [Umezakia ovalisporum]MBI1242510.1 HigA family addiction module antidote protein [Nostoc sp. RI_552]MDH6085228.1 HigA family addiction module antitoxin [Umezakia ovalisporum TAC611]MDH6087720.1 HigA family addiction module antitoxin [Umezakia ovalisporum Ak1311]
MMKEDPELQEMDQLINKMRPVHSGEIFREDFITPMGMGGEALAVALHLPPWQIQEILDEQRSITADTAFWLVLILVDITCIMS